MPRVSAAEKQLSYERILKEASKHIRKYGIEKTSVSDVMKSAGLTHGGFYRHFASKNEMVCAAIEYAVKETLKQLDCEDSKRARGQALEKYVANYLSPEHVKNISSGCPVAALATEVAKYSNDINEVFGAQIDIVVVKIKNKINNDEGIAYKKAQALFAHMVGTITLARIATTPEQISTQLRSGQEMALRILE